MSMIPDELPLWETPVLGAQKHTPGDVQTTIAARIESLLGYTSTNELFIKFIDEFGHPNQLTCLADRELSEEGRQKLIAKIRGWEAAFTDSVYRAAIILAKKEKQSHPERKGINMESIIPLAQDLIQKENEEHESARHDLGYRD